MRYQRTRHYLLVEILSTETHEPIGRVAWESGLIPFANNCRNQWSLVSEAGTILRHILKQEKT